MAAAACWLGLASIASAQTSPDIGSPPPAATAVEPIATPPTPFTSFSELPADAEVDVLSLSTDSRRRMTVPVNVKGSGPYQFLVDTGAERTVISRQLARRLALEPGRFVRVHSMTGAIRVETAFVPEIRVSKKTLTDVHAPALEAAHIGAAGMLGVDTLQAQRVTFDFVKSTMSIVSSKKKPERWGDDVIVVTGRRLYGRLILTDAHVNGEKILVVIDTGAEMTIGNEALRRKLLQKRKLREINPVTLISVTGDRFEVDYTAVKEIHIGDLAIQNMPIGFKDVHPFVRLELIDRPAILLGMDALRLFDRVSVDFERKQVRFYSPSLSRSGIMMGSRALPPKSIQGASLAATLAAKRSTFSSDKPATLKRPEEAM